MPLTEQLSRLGKNFIQAIRSRPLTQEILAWEMVERNKLTAELETIRENTMMNFFDMCFPAMNNGPDIAAVGAIIGGGVSYLVTRARQIHLYNGVDLQSEAGWQRLEKAIDTIKVLDQKNGSSGSIPCAGCRRWTRTTGKPCFPSALLPKTWPWLPAGSA